MIIFMLSTELGNMHIYNSSRKIWSSKLCMMWIITKMPISRDFESCYFMCSLWSYNAGWLLLIVL